MSMSSTPPNIVFLAGINHENGTYTKYTGEKYRQFREAYGSLFGLFAARGVHAYFAEIEALGADGMLSAYFMIDAVTDDTIRLKKIVQPMFPDLVINRVKDALYEHPAAQKRLWKIYNEHEVAKYGDKSLSQAVLAAFMPESLVVNAETLDTPAIDTFFSRHSVVVSKPLRLNGGRGIELLHTSNEVRMRYASEEGVLQEFIETAEGIPGLAPGRHDVRIYIIDGVAQMMALRQPREGEFLANTAAGGSIEFYGLGAVPAALRDLTQEILRTLSLQTPHYFISLDFFYGNGKWYLIEVNDQPGVPAEYQTAEAATLHNNLISSIIEYVS